MTLTVADVLALDVVRAASPQVLAGAGALARPVRWVHTSEIYEIGPLLSGGELLLTSGLGLLTADPGARRYYVRDLAARDVAAVALALNRSFDAVPAELVDEARKAGLPLIVLREVVPFVGITETVNTLLIEAGAARLHLGERITVALQRLLAAEAGVADVLGEAGRILAAPLVLVSAGGSLLATYGTDGDREARAIAGAPAARAEVVLHGETWAGLHAGPGSPLGPDELGFAVERVAGLLALAALHAGRPAGAAERRRAELLAELLDDGRGGPRRTDLEAVRRAARLGFHPQAGDPLVPVAVDDAAGPAADAVLGDAARRLDAPHLWARVRGHVLGLLAVPSPHGEPVAALGAALAEAVARVDAGGVTVAIGPPVVATGTRRRLGTALAEARETLGVALAVAPAEPGPPPPVVSARALALELELTRAGDRSRLAALVETLLEPLAAWDRTHTSDLQRTLEVHLRHGCRPSRTAEILHLGRQTLYQRLARIEALLGRPVTDPELHVPLLLALCARRVLAAAP